MIATTDQHFHARMRATPPTSRRELWFYLLLWFELAVPRVAVCDDHCAPMDYVEDAYFNRSGKDILVWANRSGGKTQLGGALTTVEIIHRPRYGVRILGGSKDQSLKMYEHVHALRTVIGPDGRDWTEQMPREPTATGTKLPNGASVQILTQSMKSVRGPHVPRLRLDEVDEFDPAVFAAALPIRQSLFGYAGRIEMVSTLHKPVGLMSDLSKSTAHQIYRWCVFETCERCREGDRSCSRCPLDADCQGKARRSDGYIAIDDLINLKAYDLSPEAWEVEMLCRRPASTGLIYPYFSPEMHVQPCKWDPTLPTYAGWDWGFANPTAITFGQVGAKGQIRIFSEYYQPGKTPAEHGEALRERFKTLKVRRSWCDPEDPAARVTVSKIIRSCRFVGAMNAREKGIENVRRHLNVDPDTRQPRLIIDPSCENHIRELQAYHMVEPNAHGEQREEPRKADDHTCDSLRYLLMGCSPPRIVTPTTSSHGRGGPANKRVFAGSSRPFSGGGRRRVF